MKGDPLVVFLKETQPGVVGKATIMSSTVGSFTGDPGDDPVLILSISELIEDPEMCKPKLKIT